MIQYCLSRLGWAGGLALALLLLWSRQVYAHQGTLIDSGTSPSGQYGWMLSISPDPVTTGPVNLSLIVFDTKSSAVVNTVQGELYLAAPDSPRPCCEPDVHRGPLPLLLEPFQFGDYIAYVPIDQVGSWEVQLRLTVADDSFTVVAPFEVVANGGLDQAAIQAAVEELTQTTIQQMSAAAQPTSPLAAPTATVVAVAQAPSPLLDSPTPTPLAVQQPTPRINTPATRGDQRWLVGGGAVAIVVGITLLLWQMRKRK